MDNHDRGQVAASAAEIYESFFVPALFAQWPQRVLDAAQVKEGNSVLDVACGTGVLARAAVDRVGRRGSVTGVDINEGMLQVARRNGSPIVWQEGQAEALPFDDQSFDRVVSQFSLMFFTDQLQAIREMMRVLKPGGRLAVAVWGPLDETPGYAAVTEILNTLFGSQVAKSIEAPYSLGDTGRLRDLFSAADVQPVAIETITGKARFPSIDSWIYTDIKGWTLAEIINDEGYERLKAYAQEKLARFVVNSDGAVAFNAPAHIVSFSPQ